MVLLPDDRSFRTNEQEEEELAAVSVISNDDDKEREDQDHENNECSKVYSYRKVTLGTIRRCFKIIGTVINFILAPIKFAMSLLILILVLLFKISIALLIALSLYAAAAQKLAPHQPETTANGHKDDLKTFVLSRQKDSSVELKTIESIKTDLYESYASTYCLEGVTLERTRAALRLGLNIPESVRDDIVNQALMEGISAQNSWMDSKADLVNSAHAHSYMAFYSTMYIPGDDESKDVYKTCVSVSGVKFTMAQVIVDHVTTTEEYKVGFNLECGWYGINCYRVPRYAERTRKEPVFDRSKLTLKEQRELNSWMVAEAISSAQHLVGNTPQELPASETNEQEESGWDWKPPKFADDKLLDT